MFVEMEKLGGFDISVQFITFVYPTQTSTKSQPFVLRLSIVSVEVGQLMFLGNLSFVLFNHILPCNNTRLWWVSAILGCDKGH